MSGRQTKEMDKVLGRRLKAVRRAKGWTQANIAEAVDLTHQQIQKYESGANRLTVTTLYEICAVLKVSPAAILSEGEPGSDGLSASEALTFMGLMPGGPELAGIFSGLPADMRASILSVARSMASASALHGALKAA